MKFVSKSSCVVFTGLWPILDSFTFFLLSLQTSLLRIHVPKMHFATVPFTLFPFKVSTRKNWINEHTIWTD